MNEIFPIAAGVVTALIVHRVASSRLRVVLLAALSLTFGLIAALISGELAESWAFLLVDTGLVLIVAVIALGALALWRRRTAPAR